MSIQLNQQYDQTLLRNLDAYVMRSKVFQSCLEKHSKTFPKLSVTQYAYILNGGQPDKNYVSLVFDATAAIIKAKTVAVNKWKQACLLLDHDENKINAICQYYIKKHCMPQNF